MRARKVSCRVEEGRVIGQDIGQVIGYEENLMQDSQVRKTGCVIFFLRMRCEE